MNRKKPEPNYRYSMCSSKKNKSINKNVFKPKLIPGKSNSATNICFRDLRLQLQNFIGENIIVNLSGCSEGSVEGILSAVHEGTINLTLPGAEQVIPICSICSVIRPVIGFSLIQLYVANFSSNTISIIDSDPRMVTNIGVGAGPRQIAITPTTPYGSNVYVTNGGNNSVSMYTTTTPASTTITEGIGTVPNGITITPNGAFAYVTNSGSNDVSVINTGTNKVIGNPIKGFSEPCGIASTLNRVYVVNSGNNSVSVIDTTNKVIGSPIKVGNSPDSIAITPDRSKAFVTNTVDNTVSAIRLSDNTIIGTPIPVGTNPLGLAITPDGSHVYVANNISNTVSVISTSDNTVVNTISSKTFFSPLDIAITPDGSTVYVTNNGTPNNLVNTGTVSVIQNNVVVGTIALIDARSNVGENPGGIAIAVLPKS